MKYLIALLIASSSLFALNLENLLTTIENSSNKEVQAEYKRLEVFVKNKEKQKELLLQTKKELKAENGITNILKDEIDKNEKTLALKESELVLKIGDLGEIFGSVRQTSADFMTNYQIAFTSSEFPQKKEIFTKFSNSKKVPTLEELTQFWHSMLDEIIQSGKISQYETNVVMQNGETQRQIVTRVGQFSAFANGNFLQYSQDSETLVELATQPSSSLRGNAEDFEKNNDDVINILVDPTRGTLFGMLGSNPTLIERIQQGGIIGYIILVLGFLGMLFATYKMIVLNIIHSKIKKQLKDLTKYNKENPLGKIASVFYNNLKVSINDLEIKISEAILKETNHIKGGQSFVKLLAAVTPLLGLLGTVTGMIATFQAITLFGTGDPKLMAGGISTALVTTVLGLVTAIPLLFAYTYISSKAEEIVSILEEQSVGMLAKNLKQND